jgi:hypothetical protein
MIEKLFARQKEKRGRNTKEIKTAQREKNEWQKNKNKEIKTDRETDR